MAAKVKLSDIVDALEIASDEVSSFVDRETGEVLSIQHEFLTQAEEEDAPEEGTPTWQVDAYKLLNAISGRGAFRSFKDTIHRRGIQDAWYAFRDEALRDIAREWCEEEGLPFE